VAPAPLKERVVDRVRSLGELALDPEQQSILDVVDQFFSSVADNPKLSDVARQQLRQLEVPVLKVMLRDQEVLEDQDNPVRGVMNRLAQLGGRGGRSNPVIQRRIDDLVRRITTEFEQDTRVFEGAVAELDGLIERQNLAYRRNVERVTAAAEGAQKVAESKAAVAAAIEARVAGRKAPEVVQSLLDAGWRDLLSLTWIREGTESLLWQDYLSVLDSLLVFGENPKAPVNLAELLRVIQDGLSSVSSNQTPSAQIRDELKRFLLRKPDEPVVMVTIDPVPEKKVASGTQLAEREHRSLQRWIARAQKLRTGDWMCDQEKPDQPQYIRVVWIARGFSRFVFVNHQGMRVVELELEALARQMQKGIIVPDVQYERPLVDESLDHMVRKVYDQLSWVTTHDELTSLLSRREFERVLEEQLAQHEDERTLVRLDLRQFRLLNDTAGYNAGDSALRSVAEILQVHVGNGMPLGRLGGDEFGFLVPAEHAEETAAAVINEIETLKLSFAGTQYRLSANAGLAAALPALVTAERWLKAADDACKTAREQGLGRLSVYNLDAQGHALQEQIAAKVAGLGNLDEERMLLRCQKIIPLQPETRMVAQYEVLISMYNDTGNLIGAAEFVRMAERYNRMQSVDRWVVGHMLDWLRDAPAGRAPVGGICIKLSGYSLNDESLLEFIYDKLSEKDAPIERLWFEITEAAAINNLLGVAEFIEEMKELGCRFCLGNFGSGPTSYQYLRSLPVDLIKIDGAFVQHLASSETDRAIVRSMVDMAHYMGKEVIASQVETREALEALRVIGVDYAQGYVIEKPRLLSSLA
jgi:diguanylate cyclase (GGDEF)-like protein